jgi:hypothetical protein
VEQDAPATAGLYPCGRPGTPAAVVRLAWDDPLAASSTPVVVRVSYVVVPVGTDLQLHRIQCEGSATPVSDLTLAHHLEPPGARLDCPACPSAPSSLSLTVSIKDPAGGPPLTFVLSGQRRQT